MNMIIKITKVDGWTTKIEGTCDYSCPSVAHFKYKSSGSDQIINLYIPWHMIAKIESRER